MIGKSFFKGSLPINRLESLTDGVVSIILTLMVFDLKIPVVQEHLNESDLLKLITALFPRFFSWILSFSMIYIYWVNHHRFFQRLKHSDNSLIWLNGIFLISISLIPLPTFILGTYYYNSLAVTYFGCCMIFTSLSFALMRIHALKFPSLFKDALDITEFRRVTYSSLWVGPGLYSLAIAISWWNIYVSLLIYIFIAIYFIFPRSSAV